MTDNHRHIFLVFAVFFILIALGFTAVWLRIAHIQTMERAKWEEYAKGQVVEGVSLPAVRGNILDRNGRLLASSSPTYTMRFDGRVKPLHEGGDTLFTRYVDQFSRQLANALGRPEQADRYYTILVRAHREKKMITLANHVTYHARHVLLETEFVRHGQYKCGITFEARPTRTKQFGVLASRTIGSTDHETGAGLNGLEFAFNNQLAGTPGLADRFRAGGEVNYAPIREPVPGMDVVTTIDANIQDIVENRLKRQLIADNSKRGCCILLEAATGKVVALANLERASDDPTHYYEGDNLALRRFEPGSVFKTIALLAALDQDRLRITDTVSIRRGRWYYNGLGHKDSHEKDTLFTARDALAISSNIALAKLIVRAYNGNAEPFVKRVRAFGLTDLSLREIRGQNARIEVPNDRGTIGKMAYGYFVELAPIQTAALYNAIANGGTLYEPYLVQEVRRGTEVVEEYEPKVIVKHIAGDQALGEIRSALHDVVWNNGLGTAARKPWNRKAQSDKVAIAGKTGTAQMIVDGQYSGENHRITFVGYFPEDKPLYTCLMYMEVSKAEFPYYDAGGDCGAAVRDIAERVMAMTSFVDL